MQREIITTSDGSSTIFLPELNEHYHSKHGAIQEAYHVFIRAGFDQFANQNISILEMGFGTGLNAFITILEAEKTHKTIDFVGVEAYPVAIEEASLMNYAAEINPEKQVVFNKMHEINWEEKTEIAENFCLTKRQQFFNDVVDIEAFDLIYFDAFGYRVQPDLWSTEIFQKMYNALKPNGILVTYAARGVVKRSMIEVGFTVEKLPGAPGKREMFRARKL